LIPSPKYAAVLLAALAGSAAYAYASQAQQNPASAPAQPQQQPAAASTMNRNLVLLDPAHGGPDAGATLGDHIPEKYTTLAVATRLRTALTAAGFTVITTREGDAADPLTTDQRAETANRVHAVACIVLHATTTGSGVHVYTSSLQPSAPKQNPDPDSPVTFVPVPWETAQAGFVSQSLQLASDVRAALATSNLPVIVGTASLRPLDNLMCPSVAIEVAPLIVEGGGTTPVTDSGYQQRVAGALTAALRTWHTHADPPAPPNSPANTGANSARKVAQ
jgi:N-acetylmuramoyl-L-alanine amidase